MTGLDSITEVSVDWSEDIAVNERGFTSLFLGASSTWMSRRRRPATGGAAIFCTAMPAGGIATRQ